MDKLNRSREDELLAGLHGYLPREHVLQFCMPALTQLLDVDALKAIQLAAWLVEQRKETDRELQFVQLYGDNSIDWFLCMYGTWLAGAGVATASPQWTQDRFRTYVERVAATTLVIDVSSLRCAADASGIIKAVCELPLLRNIILINNDKNESSQALTGQLKGNATVTILENILEQQTFSEAFHFLQQNRQKIFFGLEDVQKIDYGEKIAFLTPSTGTTGVPKSIVITHNVQVARWTFSEKNIAARPAPATTTSNPYILLLNPVTSVTGMVYEHFNSYIFTVPRRPTGIVIPLGRRFDMHIMGRAIERYSTEFLLCPVQVLNRCFLDVEFNSRYNLSSVKQILTGAWPFKTGMHKRICQVQSWPHAFISQLFGSAEAGIMIFSGYLPAEQQRTKAGCIGVQPQHCAFEVKLVQLDDEQNETLARPNQRGEMLIKTKPEYSGNNALNPMFRGYYNDEQKTREAFSDGWYRTGDVCYRDEDDVYWHVDRTAELVWVDNDRKEEESLHWFAPAELEQIILLGFEREVVDVALVPLTIMGTSATHEPTEKCKHRVLDHLVAFIEPRSSWLHQLVSNANGKPADKNAGGKANFFAKFLGSEEERKLKHRVCTLFNENVEDGRLHLTPQNVRFSEYLPRNNSKIMRSYLRDVIADGSKLEPSV